jgi:hypothetical protein
MPSWWSNAQLAFVELNGAAGVRALERLSELNVVGVGLTPERLAELRAVLPRVGVVG